jgi:hypothetical protein
VTSPDPELQAIAHDAASSLSPNHPGVAKVAPRASAELARVGYAAYGETVAWKNYQGHPMPEWDQLPTQIRDAWRAAAAAIESAGK